MQENMKRMQEELRPSRSRASRARHGEVTMTCRHDVKRVVIDESLMKDDKDMLEDLIAAAMNDAVRARKQRPRKNGRHDGRHGSAAGHEAAV